MTWQPTQLEKQRLDKLERLKEAGVEPYPLRTERTHTTAEAISAFEAAGEDEPISATVCGRLSSVRDMGKTVFAHINDEFGRIQLFVRRDEIGE
jgi:lysyl-tRNA synthetase class 2